MRPSLATFWLFLGYLKPLTLDNRLAEEQLRGTSTPPDEERASWWERFFGLR